jgi:hypothetical protein
MFRMAVEMYHLAKVVGTYRHLKKVQTVHLVGVKTDYPVEVKTVRLVEIAD